MFGTHLGTETSPTPVTLEFPSSQASCCRADRAEGIRQADGGIKEPGQNQRCKTFVWDCPVWVLPGSDSPSAPNPPRQALPPSCGSPQPTQPFEEATRCLEAPEEHRSPPKKPCSNLSPALQPSSGVGCWSRGFAWRRTGAGVGAGADGAVRDGAVHPTHPAPAPLPSLQDGGCPPGVAPSRPPSSERRGRGQEARGWGGSAACPYAP